MPLTAALLASIAAIAGGATAAGTGIYSATQAGGGPSQPAAPPPPTAAANITAEIAKRGQDAQIARRQEPGLISATGGGLSDQAYQTEASQNAGLPGAFGQGGFDMNSILQLLQGGGSGNPTNLLSLASGSTGGSIT